MEEKNRDDDFIEKLNRKIKVMQITHDLAIGGLQKVVLDLATKLDRQKFEVTVCALREGGPLVGALEKEGVQVIQLDVNREGVDHFSFLKLYRILKTLGPDVIHTHNTHPLLDGTIAGILARVPTIVHTEHGRKFPDKWKYMFMSWLFSHFIDQIVSVSQETKEDLIKYEMIKASKVKVVSNGIDEGKFNISLNVIDKKRELGIGLNKGPILGWCGRLSPEKGLFYLIEALNLLSKEFQGILLIVVGDGDMKEDLKRKVNELKVENHILFLGARNDVPEIMKVLDLFVLPSIREGLPLVLLEAMAASLPIVATDVGGNREAVKDGINGFMVKARDSFLLYKAIKQLLENKHIMDGFSSNSLGLFHEKFSLEKMILTYEKIYQDSYISKNQTGAHIAP